MDFFRSEEERLAEERRDHPGLVDAAAGAAVGALGEHTWDEHRRKKEMERLQAQEAYPAQAPRIVEHHKHHGLLDVAGGVVAGAVGERVWDKHEERTHEKEWERAEEAGMGRAYGEPGYGEQPGYGERPGGYGRPEGYYPAPAGYPGGYEPWQEYPAARGFEEDPAVGGGPPLGGYGGGGTTEYDTYGEQPGYPEPRRPYY